MVRDEKHIKSKSFMDTMDKYIFGPVNFIDRIIGQIKKVFYPSSGGIFGKTAWVVLPRLDKGGTITMRQCVDHLQANGVPCFTKQHDDQNFYIEVRETQHRWATWLLDGGKGPKKPKRNWKDQKSAAKQSAKKTSMMDKIF